MNIHCRVYRHSVHVHVATYRTHIHMNSLTLTRRRGSGQHPEQRPDNRPLVRLQPNPAPGDHPHSPRSHHPPHTHTRTIRTPRPHPANPTTSSGRRVNRQWPCNSHNQLIATPLHHPLLPSVTTATTASVTATTFTCSTMAFFFGTDEGRSNRRSRWSTTRTKPEQAAQRWYPIHYQGANSRYWAGRL